MTSEKAKCDIIVEPDELAGYALLDVSKGKGLFEIGYKTAKKKLNIH